jgi:magnesium transporter
MHTLHVQRNGTLDRDLHIGEVAGVLDAPDSLTWLDICAPDEGDIALLSDGFHFHPLAIEDATRFHERPKVDTYTVSEPPCGSYYFVVFYAATYDDQKDQILTQAISMFIGSNYLVTVHRGDISHVDETVKRWQAPNSPLGNRVATIVHALLDALVDDYFPLMDHVADRLEDLEDSIFTQFDKDSIAVMFSLKKSLLGMRRVASPERDVLNVLLRRQLPVFSPDDTAYLQDVYDHIVRVTDSIDTYRDLLSSALDSYLSLQSNRLSEIMKLLTAASIILMYDSLIAGIYGMNFRYMPELQWPIGHLWALILMIVGSVSAIIYFRNKKWL